MNVNRFSHLRINKYRSIIFLMFLFHSASYKALAQYDTKSLISSGLNLVQNKEYSKALVKFNKAIYVKPYLFEPYFYRAYTKYILGDYFGAEKDFNEALEINPYYSEAFRFRGITRGKLNDFNRAFLDFEEGIRLDTFNVYLYINRSSLYLEIEKYDEALADCNTAIKIKPALPDVYLNRGTTYFLMEEYKKALNDFSKAIDLKPNNDLAYIKRGLVQYELEKHKKAIEDFDIAAKINPVLTITFFYRALAKSGDLDYTGAMEDYNHVIELDPVNALTYYNLALLKTYVGAIENAVKDYNKVLELRPNHILSLYNRGGLFFELKQFKNSIQDYTKAIEIFPDFPGAYINRSSVKRELGDKEGATEDYNTGLSILQKYKNKQAEDVFNAYADTSKYFKRMIELDTDFEYYNKNSKPGIHDKFFNIDILPIFKIVLNTNIINIKPLVENYNYYLNELTKTEYSDTLFAITNSFNFDQYSVKDLPVYSIKNQAYKDLYIGILNQDKQNYNSAKSYFDKSIKQDTLLAAAWFGRACLEMEIDEFLQQFNVSNTMIALSSNTIQSSESTESQGADFYLAKHDLEKTISLLPDFALAYYNLANLNCIQGDFNDALINYTIAIDKAENFTEAYYNRGLVRIYLQNIDKGCLDLSKAGELGIREAYHVLKRFCKVD